MLLLVGCVLAVAVLFPGQALAETWIALKRAAFEGQAGRWEVIEEYEPFASQAECLHLARATVRWFGADEGLGGYVRNRPARYSADGLKVTLDVEFVLAHEWRVYALEMRCWPVGGGPSASPASPLRGDPRRWARPAITATKRPGAEAADGLPQLQLDAAGGARDNEPGDAPALSHCGPGLLLSPRVPGDQCRPPAPLPNRPDLLQAAPQCASMGGRACLRYAGHAAAQHSFEQKHQAECLSVHSASPHGHFMAHLPDDPPEKRIGNQSHDRLLRKVLSIVGRFLLQKRPQESFRVALARSA